MLLSRPVLRRVAGATAAALAVGIVPFVAAAPTASAAPTELFISEYVEGSSNNKALEIYNGTGATVDLAAAGYNVQVFSNGARPPASTIDLTGTVATGDVFVLANSLGGSAAILAQADQTSGVGQLQRRRRRRPAQGHAPSSTPSARSASTPAPSGAPASPRRRTTPSAARRPSRRATPTAPTPSTPPSSGTASPSTPSTGSAATPSTAARRPTSPRPSPRRPRPTARRPWPSTRARRSPSPSRSTSPPGAFTLACSLSGSQDPRRHRAVRRPSRSTRPPTSPSATPAPSRSRRPRSPTRTPSTRRTHLASDVVVRFSVPAANPCEVTATPIPAIQGSGDTAAVTGTRHDPWRRRRRLRGPVTGPARLLPPGPDG